jgi:hypothetical protein
MMHQAAAIEFPFLSGMPRAERTSARDLWGRFVEFAQESEKQGGVVTPALAAKMLRVSRQRIWALMKSGTLVHLDFEGHAFVTGDSIKAYAESERKSGRPLSIDRTLGTTWSGAKEAAKEIVK